MTAGDLPDAVAALLLDMELTDEERATINPFELLDLELPLGPCPAWREHRAVLLPYFVRRHPGRRPSRWWRYDAPRRPGRDADSLHELPRMRLGGTGTAAMDVFAAEPRCHCGIPVEWLTEDEEIEWCAAEGIEAVRIDPSDPPIYEAQAAYLKRYGLLLRGEERRLTPADFEPEEVVHEPSDEGNAGRPC